MFNGLTTATTKLLLFLTLFRTVAGGQIPGSLAVPTVGFVFDFNARAFRPIVGIVGGSALGDPIDIGQSISSGFSLPDNRHALAVLEEGNSVAYLDFVARPVGIHIIPGVATGLTSYGISPNGKNAVVIDAEHQRLQVLTGFPSDPSIALDLSAETLPEGKLLRAAVDDAATALLVTMSFGDTEAVYRWNRNSGFVLLTPSFGVAGLTFINAFDAIYADKVRNEVFLVHDVKGQPWVQFIAGTGDGIMAPVAAASSGNEFHIANAASGTIISFDVNGHLLRSQLCSCRPSRLSPIAPETFLITDRLNETMFVISGTGVQSRIAFIPPTK